MASETQNPLGGAYSVNGFCFDYHISRAHLYNLWRAGKGPRQMKVGKRTLISYEAARDWRRACEAGA